MTEIRDVNDGSREFNAMQRVKRRFFAMRNGALARQMEDCGGKKYQINFGLNIPQISEIARDFLPGGAEYQEIIAGIASGASDAEINDRVAGVKDSERLNLADFARKLRDNRSTRESMLIAPMLFPVDGLSRDEALEWARTVATPEVADILCIKLLRNHKDSAAIANSLLYDSHTPLATYAGLRLMLNLLQIGRIDAEGASRALDRLEGEEPSAMTRGVLRQLREEISFLKGEY